MILVEQQQQAGPVEHYDVLAVVHVILSLCGGGQQLGWVKQHSGGTYHSEVAGLLGVPFKVAVLAASGTSV